MEAQEQQILVQVKNEPLINVFSIITEQTNIRFSYSPDIIDVDQKITINIKSKNIDEILRSILPSSVNFKLIGKYVIISKKELIADNNKKSETNNTNNTQNLNEKVKKAPKLHACEIKPYYANIVVEKIFRKSYPEFKLNNIYDIYCINSFDESYRSGFNILEDTTGLSGGNGIITDNENDMSDKYIINKKKAQFTVIYPIATDGRNSKNTSYNFSFNMIGGITGKINGFEIGGIFNVNPFSFSGLQLAGIFNSTGTSSYESVGNSKNFQIAGGFNYTKKGKSFLQLSAVTNIADESYCQIALGYNYTKKGGFQLGLVNRRDTADGISIGVLNLVKNGGLLEFGFEAGEYILPSFMLRSGTKYLYNIISIGLHNKEFSINSEDYKYEKNLFFTWGAGIGTKLYQRNKFDLDLELMYNGFIKNYRNIMYFEPVCGNVVDQKRSFDALIQFKPVFEYKFSKFFKLYAGPSFNLLVQTPIKTEYEHYDCVHDYSFYPPIQYDQNYISYNYIYNPPYKIFNFEKKNKYRLSAWIGFSVGVKF